MTINSSIFPALKSTSGEYLHVAYLISSDSHSAVGLLGYLDCNQYQGIKLMPHERTYAENVLALAEVINKPEDFVEPIMLLTEKRFEFCQDLKTFLKTIEPIAEEQQSGKRHALYVIHDEKLNFRCRNFIKLTSRLLIADGHHRIEALNRVNKMRDFRDEIWLPAIIFQSHEIEIDGYAVSVSFKSGKRAQALLDDFTKEPGLKKIESEDGAGTYRISHNGSVTLYKPVSDDTLPTVGNLHTYIRTWLQRKVPSEYISLVPERLVNTADQRIVTIDVTTKFPVLTEIFSASKNSILMPEKVTYFHPKPLSNLVRQLQHYRNKSRLQTASNR